MGFSRFQLSPSLFQAITNLGFAEPTPIQAQAIPDALIGKDVRACAQTGTGKTLAFVIPIIEKLIRHPAHQRPSALILTPTRELASQVIEVVNNLLRGTHFRSALILGGANINQQIHQVKSGADILVATPGRLKDLLNRGAVSLKGIRMLVLDEADRMLDMGFLPDIRKILSTIPPHRQSMLFSATFGPDIKQLTHQFLKNPVVVDLSPASTSTSENVTQMIYPVSQEQKRALLQALLELGNMTSALIFTRTKHGANKLLRNIQDWGKKAAVIHSNRSQSQRQQALQGFKDRRYQILVATDIAARGIDVKDISHVINFDVPRHPEDYVHRIGRTGRAKAIGEAFTLVSPDEEAFLRKIEQFIKKTIPRSVIPDFPYKSQPKVFSAAQANQQQHHSRSPHSNGPPKKRFHWHRRHR
jgi:ATP-dependent RNA helicase RhlE